MYDCFITASIFLSVLKNIDDINHVENNNTKTMVFSTESQQALMIKRTYVNNNTCIR